MIKNLIFISLFLINTYAFADNANLNTQSNEVKGSNSIQSNTTCPCQNKVQNTCQTCNTCNMCNNNNLYQNKLSYEEKEFNSAFYFSLGATDIIGIYYSWFLNNNFALSLSGGILPNLGNFAEEGDEGEDFDNIPFLPLISFHATYFANINNNNKIYVGLSGLYIVVPFANLGYEFVSDNGFSLKLGVSVPLFLLGSDEVYGSSIPFIPSLAIGSRF